MVRKNALNKHFRVDFDLGEDVCLWIELAYMCDLLGITEPLTKVRVTASTAALDQDKQIVGIGNIVHFLMNHPLFSMHIWRFVHSLSSLRFACL